MEICLEDFAVVRFRGDVFPAIFVPKYLYKDMAPIVLLRSNQRKVVVSVFPNQQIKNKTIKSEIAINTNAYKALGEPKKLTMEPIDSTRTIFVYDTLLSRYRNPHTGELNQGWINFDVPPIRGIVKDLIAVWPREYSFPLAQRDNKIILGEVYPNVPVDIIEDLNYMKSAYRREKVSVYIAENYAQTGPIEAEIYVYTGKRRFGLESSTFRFRDSYYIPKSEFRTYKFSKDLFVKWIYGNSSVILASPHGGFLRPPDIPTSNNMGEDSFTLEITENIVACTFESSGWEILPSAVISRIHRSYVDLNRPWMPRYEKAANVFLEYHGVLERMVRGLRRKHGKALILDIHGMKNYCSDIVLGTNYGRSIRGFKEEFRELQRILETKFSVTVDGYGLTGYYTTMKYGSMMQTGVVQIEIARSIRMDDQRRKELVELITEFIVALTSNRDSG